MGNARLLNKDIPDVDFVFFELPFTTQNASSARGDVVKLCIACGMMLQEYFFSDVIPIRVIDWKGTMKDKMTGDRVRRHLEKDYPEHELQLTTQATHELDAIGIGMYVKGEF